MYLNIYRIGYLQPFFVSFTAVLELMWFYLKYLMISQAITVSDPGLYLLLIFPLFSFLQLHFQDSLEKKTHHLRGQSKEKSWKLVGRKMYYICFIDVELKCRETEQRCQRCTEI